MKKSSESAKSAKETRREIKPEEVKVIRCKEMKSGDVAFDLQLFECVTIYNCFYKEVKRKGDGEEFTLITFPQVKGKDGEWYNNVYFFVTDDVKAEIVKQLESLL